VAVGYVLGFGALLLVVGWAPDQHASHARIATHPADAAHAAPAN
jgi:hypothetical protein